MALSTKFDLKNQNTEVYKYFSELTTTRPRVSGFVLKHLNWFSFTDINKDSSMISHHDQSLFFILQVAF